MRAALALLVAMMALLMLASPAGAQWVKGFKAPVDYKLNAGRM